MMEGVLVRGTGQRARIPGYRIAGKSGTAKKVVSGAYSTTDYVASFGGFGPVNAPRVVAFVVIDTPRGGEYYGGQVAAPVFQRIMQDALGYLRAPSDDDLLVLRRADAPTADAPNVMQ